MKNILYLFLLAAVVFTSCDTKEEWEQINSKAVDYAGEWYFAVKSGSNIYKDYDGNKLLTYNTSADLENEIWIDAVGPEFTCKTKVNFTGSIENFVGKASANVYVLSKPNAIAGDGENAVLKQYDNITITKGKVIKDGAKSKTGITVDSIYMEATATYYVSNFSSVASGSDWVWSKVSETTETRTFVIGGHMVSGFLEDQY